MRVVLAVLLALTVASAGDRATMVIFDRKRRQWPLMAMINEGGIRTMLNHLHKALTAKK